jgi:hypothetical protein
MQKFPYDKKHLPFGHSGAVLDQEVMNFLNMIPLRFTEHMYDVNVTEEYLERYHAWIRMSALNLIAGLDDFPYKCYSHGTTESFDKFYMKHKDRRFRCFRGEYLYHQLAWRDKFNWLYADDDCLDANDALVISLPFSNTGNKHKLHEAALNECDRLGIPVLLDCCYFGISSAIEFNFKHECITDIVFSLSKTFPVAHARIGMRLSKYDDDDTLFVYNKNSYVNRLGAYIGLQLMENYSPDFIYKKYKSQQLEFCKHLDVEPSSTVLFGIAPQDKYVEYNRGSGSPDAELNRLSFHKFLSMSVEEFAQCIKQE